jgi:glutathione S-transferase
MGSEMEAKLAVADYHIIGHSLCPYVQRVVILMEEKKINYRRTDIDLNNKPQWLLELSPTAKVPVLVVDEKTAVFESSVICEYLDEASEGSMHPDTHLTRAHHRAWISYGSEILDCIAKIIYHDKTLTCVENTMAEIARRFHIVEAQVTGDDYFYGSEFRLIDAVYATIFRYFELFSALTHIDPLLGLNKVNQWREHLQQRPTVQQAVPENYQQLLREFIKQKDSFISQLDFS